MNTHTSTGSYLPVNWSKKQNQLREALKDARRKRNEKLDAAFLSRVENFLNWLPSAAEKHQRSAAAGGPSRIARYINGRMRVLRKAQEVLKEFEDDDERFVYFHQKDLSLSFDNAMGHIKQPLERAIELLTYQLDRVNTDKVGKGEKTSARDWHKSIVEQYTLVLESPPSLTDKDSFRIVLDIAQTIAGFPARVRPEILEALLST